MYNLEERFASAKERMEGGYKTGYFYNFRNEKQEQIAIEHDCDCLGAGMVHIDWYLTRTKERKPVIRVKWYFPVKASRKVYDKLGFYSFKKTWECIEKNQKFPFTLEGLEAAAKFAESL